MVSLAKVDHAFKVAEVAIYSVGGDNQDGGYLFVVRYSGMHAHDMRANTHAFRDYRENFLVGKRKPRENVCAEFGVGRMPPCYD